MRVFLCWLLPFAFALFAAREGHAQHPDNALARSKAMLDNSGSAKRDSDSPRVIDTLFPADMTARDSSGGLLRFLSDIKINVGYHADYVSVPLPPTSSTVQNGVKTCVTRISGGSEWNTNGASLGFGYHQFDLEFLYTDLSVSLGQLHYQFKTFGAELGYQIPLRWIVPSIGKIVLWDGANVDICLHPIVGMLVNAKWPKDVLALQNDGFDQQVIGAPEFVPEVGIGLSFQFDLGSGIRLAPEVGYKRLFRSLVPGDDVSNTPVGAAINDIASLFSGNSSSGPPSVTFVLADNLVKDGWTIRAIRFATTGDWETGHFNDLVYDDHIPVNSDASYTAIVYAIDKNGTVQRQSDEIPIDLPAGAHSKTQRVAILYPIPK